MSRQQAPRREGCVLTNQSPAAVGWGWFLLPNDYRTNCVNESALMPAWEVQGTSWKWQGIFWVPLSAEA